MRKFFTTITIVWFFLSAINAFAGTDSAVINDDAMEGGFHGGLVIGAIGFSGTPSQLDATDDNKIAMSLFKKAKSSSRVDPVILPELGYTFASTGTDISLGSIEDGTFNLTLTQFIGNVGIFSIAGSYADYEVWKDPYLVNVKRKKTDVKVPGVELSWAGIFGSGFIASFSYQSVDVKDDTLAERFRSLKRDGEILTANVGMLIPISENNTIQPFSIYSVSNMEGESNSSVAYGGGVGHTFQWLNISMETTANITWTEFDKKHPVYHKIRDETAVSLSEMISYDGLFGFENISAYLLITYQLTNSNIDFFDSSSLTAGIGVVYSF
jgi:hypothetical protein